MASPPNVSDLLRLAILQPDPAECLERNELGDAELFASLFAHLAAYDHAEDRWYLFSEAHWAPDRVGHIYSLVGDQLAAAYLNAATEPRGLGNQDLAARLIRRSRQLLGLARMRNVLQLAASMHGIRLRGDEWDVPPLLLPVRNGVVDLATGVRRDVQPSDYLRIHAPTDFLGLDYPAPRWERLLSEVFAGKGEMIAFFRRLCGYALSGDRREQILPILWGKGSNGKSTIMDAIARVLGDDLCFTTQSDVLLDRGTPDGNGARPFVAAMRDKRLVLISESREGSRLNTGLIKQLTGDEKITVRGLYSNPVSFRQTCQPMLITNHRPAFPDGGDEAIWRRVRLVPFSESFVDQPTEAHEHPREKGLLDTLHDEAPGILAWLVRGCVEWCAQGGLNPPPEVLSSTDAYRREEDHLRQFMDECLTRGPDLQAAAEDLRRRYEAWCAQQGHDPLSVRALGHRLTDTFGPAVPRRFGHKVRKAYIGVALAQ